VASGRLPRISRLIKPNSAVIQHQQAYPGHKIGRDIDEPRDTQPRSADAMKRRGAMTNTTARGDESIDAKWTRRLKS